MKTVLFAAILTISLLAGCASPNPNYDASKPASATNQPYAPNKSAAQAADTAGAVAPLVPPPWGTAVAGLGLLVGVVASTIAKIKNDQAISAAATASQLAASVVAQGPTVAQSVLDHASANEAVYPAVADVVNKKTVV